MLDVISLLVMAVVLAAVAAGLFATRSGDGLAGAASATAGIRGGEPALDRVSEPRERHWGRSTITPADRGSSVRIVPAPGSAVSPPLPVPPNMPTPQRLPVSEPADSVVLARARVPKLEMTQAESPGVPDEFHVPRAPELPAMSTHPLGFRYSGHRGEGSGPDPDAVVVARARLGPELPSTTRGGRADDADYG